MAGVNGDISVPPDVLVSSDSHDALLHHMEITIVEAEKRFNGPLALKEHYTVYLIETKVTDGKFTKAQSIASVWRRYTEFEMLKNYLEQTYPSCVIPPLPEKKGSYQRASQNRSSKDAVFIERRRIRLEGFLLRLAVHPVLSWDQVFLKFLQGTIEWDAEKQVLEESILHVAENKIKTLALRLRKPDDYFENLRVYSTNLQANLNDFLRLRVNLADSLYGLHKLHANYGRVFSEWSALEKSMGDGLQKSGHYMDCYASSIDSSLEEEDLLMDDFKDYLFFAQSLQSLCLNHTAFQNNVEKAQQQLAAHQQYKEKVTVPFNQRGNFLSRWASVPETEEVRLAKLESAEKSIAEAENQLHTASEKLSKLSIEARVEVSRFNKQKEDDLRQALAGYVLLQQQRSKMGLQTWKNIRQALSDIS